MSIMNTAITFTNCPICRSTSLRRRYDHQALPVCLCEQCSLEFLNPQTSDEELERIYTSDYFIGSEQPTERAQVQCLKSQTAAIYLARLPARMPQGCLLEIGCGNGDFLIQAKNRGYIIAGIDYSTHAVDMANKRIGAPVVQAGTFEKLSFPENNFDVVALFDLLEHTRNPASSLKQIFRILKPGGTIMIVTPARDSWTARLMGRHWMEYKAEHLFYFNRNNLTAIMRQAGFSNIELQANVKCLDLSYITWHFLKYRVPVATAVLRGINRIVPEWLAHKAFKIRACGLLAMAYKNRVSLE